MKKESTVKKQCQDSWCKYYDIRQGNYCSRLKDIALCNSTKTTIRGNSGNTIYTNTINQADILPPKPPKSANSYYFQGPINFTHLTNECIKAGNLAFLVIDKTVCFFGVSRQVSQDFIRDLQEIYGATRIKDAYLPFHVFSCGKQNITYLLTWLKTIKQEVKSRSRKTAKNLYKDKKAGKFSNLPSTKVIVF